MVFICQSDFSFSEVMFAAIFIDFSKIKKINLLAIVVIFSACNRPSEGLLKAGEHIKNTIVAKVETDVVPQKKNEDSPTILLSGLIF